MDNPADLLDFDQSSRETQRIAKRFVSTFIWLELQPRFLRRTLRAWRRDSAGARRPAQGVSKMWSARMVLAAAITVAAGGSGTAAESGKTGPRWLTDPQSDCYVFYMDRHPADVVAWPGECPDGMASGAGMATFTDRGRFVESITGPFLKGAAEGDVRVTWADGSHFEGTESAGRFNGPGVLTHANGDRFEGQWTNNRLNGHGLITWANGDRYDGELRDSKAEGHGVQTWTDGRKYDGLWKNDLPDGHGVLTRKDGSAFEGQFVSGEPQAPVTTSAEADETKVAAAAQPAAVTPSLQPAVLALSASLVAPASATPATAGSLAPGWLAPLAGGTLVAVDGARMAVSVSGGGILRETTAPGGAAQKTWFTFLNTRQGTVSDTSDAAKVTGVFRMTQSGLTIDYADGRSELLSPNTSGLAVTTTMPGRGSFCTTWYPQGHSFTSADREAALAAYASQLGVVSSKHRPAACAATAPETASPKTEASTRPATRSTHGHHASSEKSASVAGRGETRPMLAIAVRDSQVHPIDLPQASAIPASATVRKEDPSPQPAHMTAAIKTPSACLSVESDGASLGFRNHCGFAVQFAWCVRAGSDAAKSCNGGGMAGAVPANGFGPLFAQNDLGGSGFDLRWIACSGAIGNVRPRLVDGDPPAGECVHARS
jgi:hypothetical protein